MEKQKIYGKMKDYIFIFLGCTMMAFSVVVFMAPNNILDGGFTGIAIILNRIWGTPIGIIALGMMSIALTISYFVLGSAFGLKTIIATVYFTMCIDFFDKILHIQPLTHDFTLAVFYGGSLTGIALAMIFYSGASTGGTDAVAMMIKKFTGISLGRALMIIDFSVAFIAGLFFGAEPLMYSLILIFVETQVIDIILNGISSSKRLWIVSSKWKEINSLILDELERGATIIDATGAYTGKQRKIIITYIPRRLATKFRRQVHDIDPDVFIAVDPSSSVYGEGFKHPKYD